MNVLDYVLILIIAAGICISLRNMFRRKKKDGCGCSGCGKCGGKFSRMESKDYK